MFDYDWTFKDYPTECNKKKVFGAFSCGGGSTMGFKLAGFEHLGGIEIDKKFAKTYLKNHNPRFFCNEDIRKFNTRKDLPEDLYDLDILEGSPPCSSFSMSGNREKDWGKKKKFAEGQELQTLDDLFFHFIELANILKPKIIIAENVRGMLFGNAKAYLYNINVKLKQIGYIVQVFLLNSATMGVLQARQRVFIIASRKDLKLPSLKLSFNQKPIPYKDIEYSNFENKLSKSLIKYYDRCEVGKSFSSVTSKGSFFNWIKCHPQKSLNTIIAKNCLVNYRERRLLCNRELTLGSSFPLDYDFCNVSPVKILGMSVPPVMIASIAREVYTQWFK